MWTAGDTVARACLRLIKVRTSGTVALQADADLALNGGYACNPGIGITNIVTSSSADAPPMPLRVATSPSKSVAATLSTATDGTDSDTTTVSIKSASLAPGGVDVTVGYSCFPFGYGKYFYNSFGDVEVGQVSGAIGDSSFHPACNDRKQTQTVFVPGFFTAGDAAVRLFVCGFDCNSTTKEVKVR